MQLEASPQTDDRESRRAYLILLVMPLFFSSNVVFGRAAIAEVEPFTLAFIRWFLTFTILLPFAFSTVKTLSPRLRAIAPSFLLMGFLGMWICGAIVYLALKYTSATNGTLIYTSSPVMIILIEWLFRGRNLGWRESLGVLIALVGVLIIVAKGSLNNLLSLQFNVGDLIFVLAAFSWAVYSVLLRSKRFDGIPALPMFALMAGCGALLLAPFAAVELVFLSAFPTTGSAWFNICGIVILASLLAFSTFQYGVRRLGASIAGIYLYLLPAYGVTMAVFYLGEEFLPYHATGIVTVLGGVVLATFPKWKSA